MYTYRLYALAEARYSARSICTQSSERYGRRRSSMYGACNSVEKKKKKTTGTKQPAVHWQPTYFCWCCCRYCYFRCDFFAPTSVAVCFTCLNLTPCVFVWSRRPTTSADGCQTKTRAYVWLFLHESWNIYISPSCLAQHHPSIHPFMHSFTRLST